MVSAGWELKGSCCNLNISVENLKQPETLKNDFLLPKNHTYETNLKLANWHGTFPKLTETVKIILMKKLTFETS